MRKTKMTKKGKTTKLDVATKSLSTLEISGKLSNLASTLQQAESSQLHEFIKKRSQYLDESIEAMKTKLKLSSQDITTLANKNDIMIEGHALRRTWESSVTHAVKVHDINIVHETSIDTLLKRFLSKLWTKMQDAEFTLNELQELLLPFGVKNQKFGMDEANDNCLPLNELIDVLQTDLLLPIDSNDQKILLRYYSTSEKLGEVDIGLFLQDLERHAHGVTASNETSKYSDEVEYRKSKHEMMHHQQRQQQQHHQHQHQPVPSESPPRHDSFSPSPPESRESPAPPEYSDVDDSNIYHNNQSVGRPRDSFADLLAHSSGQVDALAGIHHILQASLKNGFHSNTDHDDSANNNKQHESSTRAQHHGEETHSGSRDSQSHSSPPRQQHSDRHHHHHQHTDSSPSAQIATNKKMEFEIENLGDHATFDMLSAVQEENRRLKNELQGFDLEFFEQLEDLKFKYSRLQSLVGEPSASNTRQGVDKLAWAHNDPRRVGDSISGPLITPSMTFNQHQLHRHGGSNHARDDDHDEDEAEDHFEVEPHHNARMAATRSRISEHSSVPTKQLRLPSNSASALHEAADNENSFAMCERRLLFELTNTPNPEKAVQLAIRRLTASSREGESGFVNCQQLFDTLVVVGGLGMSMKEVEMVALGIASNGKGSISCRELCDLLRSSLHAIRSKQEAARRAAEAEAADEQMLQREQDEISQLMMCLVEELISQDSNVLKAGSASSMQETIMDAFQECDVVKIGYVDIEDFIRTLRSLDVLMPEEDLERIAVKYLTHSLSKRSSNQREEYVVDYAQFTKRAVDLIQEAMLLDDKIGRKKSNSCWVVNEFDIVDVMICQLEDMSSSQRRKTLMNLQYHLACADVRKDQEIDGFSVLQALLTTGFKIPRSHRVQLLRVIEELGGRLNYNELVHVLMKSCVHWTEAERSLIGAILKAMGVTVAERRTWLMKVKNALIFHQQLYEQKTVLAEDLSHDSDDGSDCEARLELPPAAFLRVLRDHNVNLSIEQEASLLDSLDSERQAEQVCQQLWNNNHHHDNHHKRSQKIVRSNQWDIPMVSYKSFLVFCSRHCGYWMDANMTIKEQLEGALLSAIPNARVALEEFLALIHAFDEERTGIIDKRSFLVVCRRCRWMKDDENCCREEFVHDLMTLMCTNTDYSVSSGNLVRLPNREELSYVSLVVHLKTLLMCRPSEAHRAEDTLPDIAQQLLQNGCDDNGLLRPLRAWIINNVKDYSQSPHQVNSWCGLLFTDRQIVEMLRHFDVVYRPSDLIQWKQQLISPVLTVTAHGQGKSSSSSKTSLSSLGLINAMDIMMCVMKLRKKWTDYQPRLSEQLLTSLQTLGRQWFTLAGSRAHGNELTGSQQARLYTHGDKGIATAAVQHIMLRLETFVGFESRGDVNTDSTNSSFGNNDMCGLTNDSTIINSKMLEKDILGQLLKTLGVPVSPQDLSIWADYSDAHPLASHVSCAVIMQALSCPACDIAKLTTTVKGNGDGNTANSRKLRTEKISESSADLELEGLKHIKDLLWAAAATARRSASEWIADVHALFKGFDCTNTGFISSQDFSLALGLLNSSVSVDILRNISVMPAGPGLIAYKLVLDSVLVPPKIFQAMEKPVTSTEAGAQGKLSLTQAPASSGVEVLVRVLRRHLQHLITGAIDPNQGKTSGKLGISGRSSRSSTGQLSEEDDHLLNMDNAWLCLLKIFQRYDTEETNLVTAREFCLCVSLLMSDRRSEDHDTRPVPSTKNTRASTVTSTATATDDVLLTEQQWIQVINQFKVVDSGIDTHPHTLDNQPKHNNNRTRSTVGGGREQLAEYHGVMVDYMAFIDFVLDKKEVAIFINQSRVQMSRSSSSAALSQSSAMRRSSSQESLRGAASNAHSPSTHAAATGRHPSATHGSRRAGAASSSDTSSSPLSPPPPIARRLTTTSEIIGKKKVAPKVELHKTTVESRVKPNTTNVRLTLTAPTF